MPPRLPPHAPDENSFLIRDVWSSNLDQEFAIIRDIVDDYPYIAMDTEFPGVAIHPVGNFKNHKELSYQALRENVNLLKLIQLGLAFANEQGHHPSVLVADSSGSSRKFCVWQFNFREFNIEEDVAVQDSINLLKRSGIDFSRNSQEGIDARRFGELLMSSGIVLNDSIQWVTFHSGYDFGYLVKLLRGEDLPETQEEFFNLLKLFFPRIYDIKYLMKFCDNLHGGLNRLANTLEVMRVGISHQAGSDCLLTLHTFMRFREMFLIGTMDQYSGVIFGLGCDARSERRY